jgi:phage terminase large subunit
VAGIERIRVRIPYEPRAQFKEFHKRTQRWACLIAHRRAGKTVACVNDLNRAAILCTKQDGRYAYIAPFYVQAKDVAWTYLKRYSAPIPGVVHNESELRVDYPNGARVRLYGADNADRLRGGYLDGVILDEYADMAPSVWGEVIRPMLADRRGWAVFIGTPKGRNELHKQWLRSNTEDGWYPLMLKASTSALISQSELDAARAEMTPEQYEQEFECSFDAAIMGAYYGKDIAESERAGRIRDVPLDPALPLYTAVDLGIDDPMAMILFQVAHDGIRVIDHYENNGHKISHYKAEWQARGYGKTIWLLPHDGRVKELISGRTRIEEFASDGADVRIVPNHRVMDGINAARMAIPRMWFNASKFGAAIEALKQYRADYDEKAKVFRTSPKHDWTSHTADAFRYLAVGWKELIAPIARKPAPAYVLKPDGTYDFGPAVFASHGGVIRTAETFDDILRRKRKEARS